MLLHIGKIRKSQEIALGKGKIKEGAGGRESCRAGINKDLSEEKIGRRTPLAPILRQTSTYKDEVAPRNGRKGMSLGNERSARNPYGWQVLRRRAGRIYPIKPLIHEERAAWQGGGILW